VKEAAAVLPKCTLVAPVRWWPVIVTLVPPVVVPDGGVTAVINGVGTITFVTVNPVALAA